ncbi:DUF4113 domain-containing protein [Pantoea rodasii]
MICASGDHNSRWQMKRDMFSPGYTNRLRDIPVIK